MYEPFLRDVCNRALRVFGIHEKHDEHDEKHDEVVQTAFALLWLWWRPARRAPPHLPRSPPPPAATQHAHALPRLLI